MERRWRIEMLGWLRMTHAERVIGRFRSRKSGALLAYLAYNPHRSHPREALIELFWPCRSSKVGRTNLRTELAWLRRRLEPPGVPAGAVLLAEGDTLRLNPESCVSDVAAFEAALRSAAEAGSRAERTRWLDQAVGLYHGELLPGYFDAWVMPERLRLTEAFLHAVHQLAAAREQSGDLPGALQLAWRAVGIDPLREAGGAEGALWGPAPGHTDLVRLLTASGQREVALRQGRERERLLEQEGENGNGPGPWCVVAAPGQLLQHPLSVRTAEAEALRRQLAARTREVEELQQRLLAETAEKRTLRQELAAQSAEAEELWRQLRQARPDRGRGELC